MAKKSYEIGFEDIILRRAREDDNMEDIVRLIYQTDPYIYPYWFNNDMEEAVKVLTPLLKKDKFIWNYENFYVSYDLQKKQNSRYSMCD